MGFTKAEMKREATVVVVYPHLYLERDTAGNPLVDSDGRQIPKQFKYTFLISRKADQDLYDMERALGNGRKFSDVDRLARLLIREPEGFDDFPTDARPLADRAREYFADMEGWASDALIHRAEAIYPNQLFPGNEVGGVGRASAIEETGAARAEVPLSDVSAAG